jgi:hypothetical protein
MAQSHRAPKQWCLSKHESINSYERWQRNQIYTLSQDPNFAGFLIPSAKWEKKGRNNPKRGYTDDTTGDQDKRRTADQKVTHLESMLGQIANYCPVISAKTIINNSTSINSVWQSIRLHFGFQSTGGHFLDLSDIHLEPEERPEDLYQRINSFVDDCLLTVNGIITHHGEKLEEDEYMTPTLENFIILYWLKLVHPELPKQVKLRYSTELRSRTLASLKPEISGALDSLLDEIQTSCDAKAMRANVNFRDSQQRKPGKRQNKRYHKSEEEEEPYCIVCDLKHRPSNHFLSKCRNLPEKDKRFMSRARARLVDVDEGSESEYSDQESVASAHRVTGTKTTHQKSSANRVTIEPSPVLDTFYKSQSTRLTIDSGATGSFVCSSEQRRLKLPFRKTAHSANQADGNSKMKVLGETSFDLTRDGKVMHMDALVVEELDVPILAGTAFQRINDVYPRISQQAVYIGNKKYPYSLNDSDDLTNRRVQAYPISTCFRTILWPNEYLELPLPPDLPDSQYAVEPRSCSIVNRSATVANLWPPPSITSAVGGKIRIGNDTKEPIHIKKNDQFCQIRASYSPQVVETVNVNASKVSHDVTPSESVSLDPDNLMNEETKSAFQDLLMKHSAVFDSKFPGYNGACGPIKAIVNIGPVQPPQRKGRIPLYNNSNLDLLQSKFDELESLGVFQKPEDLGICVEYLNPSFLIRKPRGGFRLVTAFADVGRYAKPQPSLMPNVDSTLRTIGQWKHIIQSDLTKAFFQIPLDRNSMKYCGVATPYKGVRVYTRSAMGMPGSETALEELMCRVLGDHIQDGYVTKIADNLFVGGNTLDELYQNWEKVLSTLDRCELRLSPSQTVINPKSTTILGWIWSQGTLSASQHRIAPLANCDMPTTVKQLRSFIGAYQVLARVIPRCAKYLSPLESITAGKSSADKLAWAEHEINAFNMAKEALSTSKSIVIPKSSDQLWIVTDAACRKPGVAATLYVTRNDKPQIAGFFSSKLQKTQLDWLPCEVEAVCIAASINYFSPYIIQSDTHACVLTDSKPCVQAYEKLCRGQFSVSPRVSTFLSTVSRYQASIRHIRGINNSLSDFGSRNPPECTDEKCQVCCFLAAAEQSVVRKISVSDILEGKAKLPFTNRPAWYSNQMECPDLRRVHSHLTQGTRPSKKMTKVNDIKRYLNSVTIARDGLLVVKSKEPFSVGERIVIPREVLNGILTAIHLQLDHPTAAQLKLICRRYFFALDMDRYIDESYGTCHPCAALEKVPHMLVEQSTSSPPEVVGAEFAADVIKRECQCILVVREHITSFTCSSIIENEQHKSLREGIIQACIDIRPLDGPLSLVRVDPAPGFQALQDDTLLTKCRLNIEIGRRKNKNKNPIAERAVQELEEELLKLEPAGGPVTATTLAIATANLNSKLRHSGMSSREMFMQRDQFSNIQIPVNDIHLIQTQYDAKCKNHAFSERAKAPKSNNPKKYSSSLRKGDLVYLYNDRNKFKARDRYLIVEINEEWCTIKKFTGSQLRNTSYKVKVTECYKVPFVNEQPMNVNQNEPESDIDEHQDDSVPAENNILPQLPCIPPDISPNEIATWNEGTKQDHSIEDTTQFQNDTSELPMDIHTSPSPRRSSRVKKPIERLGISDISQ